MRGLFIFHCFGSPWPASPAYIKKIHPCSNFQTLYGLEIKHFIVLFLPSFLYIHYYWLQPSPLFTTHLCSNLQTLYGLEIAHFLLLFPPLSCTFIITNYNDLLSSWHIIAQTNSNLHWQHFITVTRDNLRLRLYVLINTPCIVVYGGGSVN